MNTAAKQIECPLCNSTAKRELTWKARFSIASCDHCRLLFSDPMPTDQELAEYYNGFLYRKPDVARIEELAEKNKSELVKYFGQREPKSTFLDFGAGTGVAIRAATKLGWDVHFQDVDQQAHQFVRETQEIDQAKMHSTMEEIPRGYFDMIMCDNVIEHVVDPVGLVADLMDRLKPGGSLVIKTPNAFNTELYFFPQIFLLGYARRGYGYSKRFGVLFKVLRKRIWNCDPPRHLFSFTKQSFEKLCDLANESDFQISYYNTPNFEYLMLPKLIQKPAFSIRWLISLAVGTLEVLLKPIYFLLKTLKLLSPSGIALVVHKE